MTSLDALNKKFETSTPEEIIKWAYKTYGDRMGLTSSFGAQAPVMLHLVTQINPKTPIYFLDTGFLFKETHQFVQMLKDRLKLNIITISPRSEAVEEVKQRLASNNPRCCDDIKVEGMKKILKNLDCWIAGLRRDQASTRKNIKIVEDQGKGLVKVHPIANWTSKNVYDYMQKHKLPFHPLWEKGYTSIGCEPCTRPPLAGQDERSGRWAGQDKTECGIHTMNKSEGDINE